MRLRTKLFTGLMILFVVISLLTVVGGYAVYKLDKSSEAILADNFASIDYTVEMLNSLDEIRQAQQTMLHNPNYSNQIATNYEKAKENFEKSFELQATNITEHNEAEIVAELHEQYNMYVSIFEAAQTNKNLKIDFYNKKTEPAYQKIKNQILVIYTLNKNAVLARNEYAREIADNNSVFIMTLGVLSIGLTFVFILYFPIYITRPLVRLKEKLQAVSNYDYSQQLQIKSNDEIGLLASTFNTMTNRLKEYEESSVAKLMYRNRHTQAVMNQLQEGVLILDENLKVVAINDLLVNLMKLGQPKNWKGKYAPDMALKSNLMRKLIAPVLKPRSVDNRILQSSETNLVNEDDNEFSRILRIEDHGKEYVYQVTQQRFYTKTKNNKQFAGYIITVKEVVEDQPQISQMQTNSFLNQLELNLIELKNNEENQKSLQRINNLIDTTQKFNSTLNGRLNITH
ncbi:HAMP domain-containing protein [Bernardetia sp. ABR2-2B]|uniref:HAMP domain-containing protein n=1 Tax=Bernardetia sp. ABR2-2B TaxID=3127472 RepID=UPI0030D30EA1